jgi:hypothetical protein
MKTASVTIAILLLSVPSSAQRPSDPALMVPQNAPSLDYVVVAQPFTFPPGVSFDGATASVAVDPKGHVFVLTRGNPALYEFDDHGKFIRSFGNGLFARSHGLHIDSEGNLWATDVNANTVLKINREGRVLLTIGKNGELNQPTDVATASNGDLFITQGHTPGPMGDPRVLKFDKNGKFIKSWGGKGKEPGKFDVAHGIAIDAKGLLWVADRENQRIQIFDADGKFIRELKYAGLPCGLEIGNPYIYMVNGYAAQLLRMDLNGTVLAATGKSGTGPGEFAEAHNIAAGQAGEIYVADSVNSTVQKFVRK